MKIPPIPARMTQQHNVEAFHTQINLIKSTRIQIIFTIFLLIWNQTDVILVPNQSANGKYNLISGWLNKISKIFLCAFLLVRKQILRSIRQCYEILYPMHYASDNKYSPSYAYIELCTSNVSDAYIVICIYRYIYAYIEHNRKYVVESGFSLLWIHKATFVFGALFVIFGIVIYYLSYLVRYMRTKD